MMRREQTWQIDAPPERVWPYVSDTDAINRLAGTPPVTYAFDPQADGSVRVRGTMRNGPLTIRWDERPFAWSAPEYHDVERIFLNGPLRRFRARTELTARDGGTRVRTVCEMEGRGRLVEPFLPAIAARGFRGLDRDRRRALLARARQRWEGTTLLCVTHDIAETESFPRVLVVEGGRIVEDGAPSVLLADPASRYATLLEAERRVRTAAWSEETWRRLRVVAGRVVEGPL